MLAEPQKSRLRRRIIKPQKTSLCDVWTEVFSCDGAALTSAWISLA